MPGRNTWATPTVFAMMSPKRMAQRTYSMLGSARWWAVPYLRKTCSLTLPAYPMTNSSAIPGRSRARRASSPRGGVDSNAIASVMAGSRHHGTLGMSPTLMRAAAASAAITVHQSSEIRLDPFAISFPPVRDGASRAYGFELRANSDARTARRRSVWQKTYTTFGGAMRTQCGRRVQRLVSSQADSLRRSQSRPQLAHMRFRRGPQTIHSTACKGGTVRKHRTCANSNGYVLNLLARAVLIGPACPVVRWIARREASNPSCERRAGVQARNLVRVGGLVPGKPSLEPATRRGPAATDSLRRRSWAEGTRRRSHGTVSE